MGVLDVPSLRAVALHTFENVTVIINLKSDAEALRSIHAHTWVEAMKMRPIPMYQKVLMK